MNRDFYVDDGLKSLSTAKEAVDKLKNTSQSSHLQDTSWLCGPKFLLNNSDIEQHEENTYELVSPSSDADVHPEVSTLNTTLISKSLGAQRFSKFSTWKSSTRAIARLVHISRQFYKGSTMQTSICKGLHYCPNALTVEELSSSNTSIMTQPDQSAVMRPKS